MTITQVFRGIDIVRIIGRGLVSVPSSLLVAMCCLLWNPTAARAQLWETPPLPAVKYAPAPDGMTFSVGAEQVRVSVPADEQLDQEPQLQTSAEQPVEGVQDWVRAGLGVEAVGQS